MANIIVYCFIFACIISSLAVNYDNYDIIIIPVRNPGSLRTKQKTGVKTELSYLVPDNKRLDVTQFELSTDLPDIDHYESSSSEKERTADYDDVGERIVGGSQVDISLYPYHVAYGDNCAGAIIDKKWVMTAAHCNKLATFIRAGSKYIHTGKKFKVKSHYVHPLWDGKSKAHPFDYDFQLLELQDPLVFDDHVQPLKIAHIEDMVVGKIITVTGWGNIEENGPYSSVLRAIRVPIISKATCQMVPFPYFRGSLTSRMFCAGYAEEKKDACQGDSGGPAVSNDRLLGMVSFGYGCATPGSYGVYSKVAKVRPWIEETTQMKLD